MINMDVHVKKACFFLAVKEVAELFAEQELGVAYDINIPRVLAYVDSLEFAIHAIECDSKDDIYKLITDDILNGYPIWRLLNISEWTEKMLERELQVRVNNEKEKLKRKYKCYTCKYFHCEELSLGDIMKCKWEEEHNEEKDSFAKRSLIAWKNSRDEDFKLKTKCKKYEKIEE